MYLYLFSVLLIAFAKIKAAEVELPTALKTRQPNWRLEIVERHPNGSPRTLLLLEPLAGEGEIPVKFMSYHQDGSLDQEADIAPDSSLATPIFHGPFVSYNSEGAVETVCFYDRGRLSHSIKTYYPHGLMCSYTPIQDGLPHGKAERYHPNGNLAARLSYVRGKLSGESVEYHSEGEKAKLIPYQADLIHGTVTEWDEKGKTLSTSLYVNGLLHGTLNHPAWTRYHANGLVAETKDFRQGQPVGVHVTYDDAGKERSKVNYALGIKQGKAVIYSENGVITEGEYRLGIPIGRHTKKTPNEILISVALYDDSGKLKEPITEFYQDGSKKAQYWLDKGLLEGDFLEWHPNGHLLRQCRFCHDEFDGLQQEFFDHGALKKRVKYESRCKHGPYEEWHANGQLALSISYDHGVKQGEEHAWYSDGQQAKKANYHNGLIHGPHEEWFVDGLQKYSAYYKEGKIEGQEKEYFSNGKEARVGSYVDGRPEGLFQRWDESGQLQEIRYFSCGLAVGEHRYYYPSTATLARLINYREGRLHGEQKSFYSDGKPHALLTYHEGILDGKKALWDPSGTVIEEAEYSQGNLQGRSYIKKQDGSEWIHHYHNNQLDGIHQIYFPPHQFFGRVKALETTYSQGLLQGEVCEYNEAGVKISATHYDHGQKEGLANLYDQEGRLSIAAEFHGDAQNGITYEYYPTGLVKKQVLFNDDLKEGEEKGFHVNGKLASLAHYVKGQLDGTSQQWNERGILIFDAEYSQGMRHGKFNKYNDQGEPMTLQTYEKDRLMTKSHK